MVLVGSGHSPPPDSVLICVSIFGPQFLNLQKWWGWVRRLLRFFHIWKPTYLGNLMRNPVSVPSFWLLLSFLASLWAFVSLSHFFFPSVYCAFTVFLSHSHAFYSPGQSCLPHAEWSLEHSKYSAITDTQIWHKEQAACYSPGNINMWEGEN